MPEQATTTAALKSFVINYSQNHPEVKGSDGHPDTVDIVDQKQEDDYVYRRNFVTFTGRVPVAYILYDRESESAHQYFIITS